MAAQVSTELADTGSDEPGDAELERLIASCAARNTHALRDLYALVSGQLLACMVRILRRRALAEEALQDVFVSIWQRAAQYEKHRGRPRAWLVSIARNRAIDILRSERRELYRETEIDKLPELLAEPAENVELSGSARSVAALSRCFQRLSQEQRRGIELAFVNGYSHGDIAKSTGQALGTVKSWIRRGLASLRECLEQ